MTGVGRRSPFAIVVRDLLLNRLSRLALPRPAEPFAHRYPAGPRDGLDPGCAAVSTRGVYARAGTAEVPLTGPSGLQPTTSIVYPQAHSGEIQCVSRRCSQHLMRADPAYHQPR